MAITESIDAPGRASVQAARLRSRRQAEALPPPRGSGARFRTPGTRRNPGCRRALHVHHFKVSARNSFERKPKLNASPCSSKWHCDRVIAMRCLARPVTVLPKFADPAEASGCAGVRYPHRHAPSVTESAMAQVYALPKTCGFAALCRTQRSRGCPRALSQTLSSQKVCAVSVSIGRRSSCCLSSAARTRFPSGTVPKK